MSLIKLLLDPAFFYTKMYLDLMWWAMKTPFLYAYDNIVNLGRNLVIRHRILSKVYLLAIKESLNIDELV